MATGCKKLDVVWLKRDVRLTDHGPIAAVAPRKDRCVIFLYCYEPDQLAEPTVDGSHLSFVNEGLLDLDAQLDSILHKNVQSVPEFRCLTVFYANIVNVLSAIHDHFPISRLLSHEETGHWASYQRDIRVRQWCRRAKIPWVEFLQTGVTRRLRNRNEFSSKLQAFLHRPQHSTPTQFHCQVIARLDNIGLTQINQSLLETLEEIPVQFRQDRPKRQFGGERRAQSVLQSFLKERGIGFSTGISSPNSSWTSGSRLSPYLAWGHLSVRHVVQAVRNRQGQLQAQPRWSRSLTSFLSRMHWRSHFIQKMETEPELEKRDMCSAYQHLRRQPGDWNQDYYIAWSTGQTGFPLVDACMRCLHHHGWINFRMRAMLVSFATYNLWLDWKRIAPHLARLFLDYEPGIHYPQLQMQAGTTGINAMRVYNVTKQAHDQDPHGTFIRKHVPELAKLPNKHIWEPWKMTTTDQIHYGVKVGVDYPQPIVDLATSARQAKDKVSAVRKTPKAQQQAKAVVETHASRSRFRNSSNPKRSKRIKISPDDDDKSQLKLSAMFASSARWSCEACTFLNSHKGLACSMCRTARQC